MNYYLWFYVERIDGCTRNAEAFVWRWASWSPGCFAENNPPNGRRTSKNNTGLSRSSFGRNWKRKRKNSTASERIGENKVRQATGEKCFFEKVKLYFHLDLILYFATTCNYLFKKQ